MTLRRIRTVYFKELADVLRDRRTLIATIVVPVVLYPLLMLLSLQAVSVQTARVGEERVTIGVRDDANAALLDELFEEERAALADGADDEGAPTPLAERADVVVVDDLRQAVLERRIGVGVVLEPDDAGAPLTAQIDADLVFQPEEIRSQSAAQRVEGMLRRVANARVEARLAQLNIDPRAIEPVVLERETVSTPGSLLALIVPTLLVLMTVTSAIYPAIDLTAGEHERNTLEALLVAPVPILDLVAGKFLAVATIGILGATLNLVSVAATAYFGGLGQLLGAGEGEGGDAFPWGALPIILLSLVPFSVLMAGILVAVCGCARSFKEAQNYVTPVMIAVLLPAMVASLPGARLEGVLLVLPVGNMVLLVRELLSGAPVSAWAFALVLGSTCAYAAAAVAIAAQVFGRETVMFADSVSLGALLSRRAVKPRRLPTLPLVALYTAVLFPLWFYLQTLLQQLSAGDVASLLRHTAIFMPALFVVVPIALLAYWKIDVGATLRLRPPTVRHLVAGVLFGAAMWVAAQEVFVLQHMLLPTPPELLEMSAPFDEALRTQPVWLMLLFVAAVPAVSEELFFRGFLQSGLRSAMRPWAMLVVVAAVFALFHFFLFRFGTTFALGLVLAWLTWRSGSIWPAIVAHALHNGQAVVSSRLPWWHGWMGLEEGRDPFAHLPWWVIVGGLAVLAAAAALAAKGDRAFDGDDPERRVSR